MAAVPEALSLVHADFGTLVLNRASLSPSDTWPHSTGRDSQAPSNQADVSSTATSGGLGRPDGSLTVTRVFLNEKLVGKGRIGRVYRGYIRSSEDSGDFYPPHGTQVIVKLVIPQGRTKGRKMYPRGHDGQEILADLGTEASIYSLVRGIQGEVVPRCYGYYCNDVAACLVLEDCGEDLKFPYRRLPLQDRRIIFELQKRLHQAGVSHGDVARRNFVKGLQGIRLLDFDKAVRHPCQGFEEPTFEAHSVTVAENVCPELQKLFYAFGLFPMEYYLSREREAYKPWDGEPW